LTALAGKSLLRCCLFLKQRGLFPLPAWFFRPIVLKLGAWSALALEFSLGVLIWVKEFRYVLLALGLLFHLWLEYSLNIPLFQWDVLSAYVLFIDVGDLSRVWSAVRAWAVAVLPGFEIWAGPLTGTGRSGATHPSDAVEER
jgi:hypothetical protein